MEDDIASVRRCSTNSVARTRHGDAVLAVLTKNIAFDHVSTAGLDLDAVSQEDTEGKCFRITPRNGDTLGLSYSEPVENDTTFTFNGRVVLALPKGLEDFCSGKKLDVNEDGKLELG